MNYVYVKLILAGIALTVLISIVSALGIIFGLGDIENSLLQSVGFALSGLLLVRYMMKKDRSLLRFGFKKATINRPIIGLSFVIVLVQPLVLGIDYSLSPIFIGVIFVQMLIVGFVEEALFRGIFFFFLGGNIKKFIVFSSLVFGLLHAVSAINPEFPFFLVVLQVVNALLLGVIFALLYIKTKSIYPSMLLHSMFNFFASITVITSVDKTLVAVGLLFLLYLIVGWYLLNKSAHVQLPSEKGIDKEG